MPHNRVGGLLSGNNNDKMLAVWIGLRGCDRGHFSACDLGYKIKPYEIGPRVNARLQDGPSDSSGKCSSR